MPTYNLIVIKTHYCLDTHLMGMAFELRDMMPKSALCPTPL
jgi:hypothetical protein